MAIGVAKYNRFYLHLQKSYKDAVRNNGVLKSCYKPKPRLEATLPRKYRGRSVKNFADGNLKYVAVAVSLAGKLYAPAV